MGRDNFVAPTANGSKRPPIPDILGAALAKDRDAGESIEIQSALSWDYQQLGANAASAIEHTVAIKKSERRASEAIIEAGQHLIAMKGLLDHGQWGDWLAAEFSMSDRTARKMMEVAERFGAKTEIISDLKPTILYMLAGESVPEPAREQVITEAQTARPTIRRVREVIEQYTPRPEPAKPVYTPVTIAGEQAQAGTPIPPRAAVLNTPAPIAPPAPVVVREYVRQTKVVTLPAAPMSRVAIINADSRQLADMALDPVHLVVTSPPYNVGIEYDQYDDSSVDYIPLLLDVWRACYGVMADGARIAVVVPFGVGRNPYTPFDCQIMQTLVDAGFTLRGRIIWDKNTTGNRTSWGSYRLPSSPAIRDTTECIIVAHKGSDALEIPAEHKGVDDKGTHTCWLQDGDYFMELAQDHWVVAPESAQRIGHPAPFPVELVKRLMHLYTFPGAHVLDPFGGSGTVGVAAKALGCQATVIEVSDNYCAIAKERICD